ncbi:RNA-binding domain-containing protein [Thermophagus sp. OGC60D27]|uniref:RNA-binding domain-containing protein n=1 Tax=Thermophagus sp. OGC60D27 TaxID=3458415 RepID=UPI004037EEDA
MPETNRIEYKAQLTKDLDLEKEVVAFLNYHEGGLVYIGIDKNGNTLGVSDPDADMLNIKDRIKNNIAPSAMGLFDVVTEEKDGKPIIKIIVASGSEKPYFKKKYGMTEKGAYLRIIFPSSAPVNTTEQVTGQATDQVDWQSLVDTYSAIKNGAEPNQVNFLEWLQTNIQIILHELQESFGITSGKLQENFGKGFEMPKIVGSENTSGKPSYKKLPNSFIVLVLLAMDATITAEEISALIGISECAVFSTLDKLKNANMIERVGGRKEGYWHIIEQE